MACKVRNCTSNSIYADIYEIANSNVPWEKLKNKSVLITGAGGFIGYYLVLSLLERNDAFNDCIKVYALVRNEQKAKDKFGCLLDRNDIVLCVQDVNEPINTDRTDFVIHAASQASNIQFENDPVGTINANLLGTANILDFAKQAESEAVLIISSLKVYGKLLNGKESISEGDIGCLDFTDYKNCYAVGKRASETLAVCYNKQYGLNVKIARPSYIYGASSLSDDRVWAQFIADIVKGQDILLKSNGAANRSFCYVTDTVTALLFILLKGENAEPYNIAYEGSDTTIRGFAKTACQAFSERNIKLVFANSEDEPEPDNTLSPLSAVPEILNSSKLKKIGWQANVDLKTGISRSVKTLEESNQVNNNP